MKHEKHSECNVAYKIHSANAVSGIRSWRSISKRDPVKTPAGKVREL